MARPELGPDVLAYYERGNEIARLRGRFPSGPLELAGTGLFGRPNLRPNRSLDDGNRRKK